MMLHRSLALIPVLALLAACGTPQEQCIRRNTRDARVLDSLIKESEATLSRGYAIEEYQVERVVWVPCGPPPEPGKPRARCLDSVWDTASRPRAVNLDVERAKLQSMYQKRTEYARQAPGIVAACKRLHPEEKKS